MAIVSNRNTATSVKFLHFVLYSVLIITILNLCYSLARIKGYQRDYKVDSRDFRDAVVYGVTNYLATIDSQATNTSKAGDSFPALKFSDFGFYEDIRGAGHAIIDGIEYSIGDFCEFGLILSCSDRSIVCRDSDGGMVLVKARRETKEQPPQTAPAVAADLPSVAPGI